MTTDDKKHGDLLPKLEALLFIHGEPLTFKKIEKILGISSQDTEALVGEYSKRLESAESGLTLVQDVSKVQLVTKSAFAPLVEAFAKEELSEDLTPASLEVLSIVSYLGPISRSRLEYLRGVNSSFTIRNLLLRGLIERSPDPKSPNSFIYQPSLSLLKHLGLEKKEELPDFEKFKSLVEQFESSGQ